VNELPPLGNFGELARWAGRPGDWGPDGKWKVWFGGKMPDVLALLLDEHEEWATRSSVPNRQCLVASQERCK
jgi:hypothetical protein